MKRITLVILFSFMLLVLIACDAARDGEPEDATAETGPAPIPTEVAEMAAEGSSATDCPESTLGSNQLIDAARGICFLYPDRYDVFEHSDGSGYSLYFRSLMNSEAPFASVHFEPADGRSLEEVTAQRLAEVAFPDTQVQTITVGGVPASMLDNLPGQDTNRRVVAVNDDRIIDMIVNRIGENYGAVGEAAESLYTMITGSLQFSDPNPDAQLIAGPECPEPLENTIIYTNEPAGYCLLIPAEYMVQETDLQAAEMAFFVDTIQDVSHPRLFIKVEDAGDLTLEEITAEKEAEIESAIPGLDVIWSFGTMPDGVPANQFDQVPGQDLSRQLVMVHNGRVYTLVFIPDDPTSAVYSDMNALYDTVMDSFSFLWES